MTLDVEQRVAAARRRRTRAAVQVGAGLLAVLAVLVGVTAGRGGDRPAASDGQDPVAPTAAAATSPTGPDAPALTIPVTDPGPTAASAAGPGPAAAGVYVPPARRVVLPSGAEQVDEYPVRFPRTPEGAAAVAVAMTRYSTSLDYATVDEVLRLYSDPAIARQVSQLAAAGTRSLREEMGLPLTGAVGPGNAVVSRPIGVQWTKVATDVWDVSVLTIFDYRSVSGPLSKIGAGTSRVKWFPAGKGKGGDWKLVAAPGLSAPKGGPLGTAAFNDDGYAAIVEEHR